MVARQSQHTLNSTGFEAIAYEPRGLNVSNFIWLERTERNAFEQSMLHFFTRIWLELVGVECL